MGLNSLALCKHFHLMELAFSPRHRRFRSLCRHGGVRDQRFLKTKPEKKVLAVRGAAQHGGVKKGNGTWQLRLIYQSYRYFQGNWSPWFQISPGSEQHSA